MLVTCEKMLLDAQKGRYAVGAFNAENLEMAQAIVAAAEELRAPVMIQTTSSTLKYASPKIYRDMVAAIADMAICDRLTPAFLESQLDMLNGAGLVVLDANLTEESLVYLAKHVTAPLAADPVSVKKAVKLQSALPCLSLLKPNRPEASCLTGVPIGSHADLPLAAEAFFRLGLKNVFISLGSEGVYFHDGRESGIVPGCHAPIVNTSGCGDAFLAASAIAWADGCSLREAARRGQAAAAVCAGFAGAVNPNMSAAALDNLLKGDKTP